MKEETFLDSRGREVIIKIADDAILFYHGDAVRHQEQWIKHQTELGNEISDENKTVDEFYFINKQNWVDDFTNRLNREDNWHKHMKEKNWFTDEMYEYINKSCL